MRKFAQEMVAGTFFGLLITFSLVILSFISSPTVRGKHSSQPDPSFKKGIGVVTSPACDDMAILNASWYFNWSLLSDPTCGGVDERFVPRISDADDMSQLSQAIANAQASGWLIGFTEPNLPSQSNLTPAQGAVLWKQIEEAADAVGGIKLVSPSPNQSEPGQNDLYGHQWLWAMVNIYSVMYGGSPRFDAIGWNIYKQTPDEIETYLNTRRNEALIRGYDVPIWVLEYGGECWNTPGNTGNEVIITETTDWFEATPWIERYAWYANRLSGTESSCSLVDPNTEILTSLGQIYQTELAIPPVLEVSPLTKNDCYTVTNESSTLGTYAHQFYDEFDSPVHSFADVIPALDSKVYNLSELSDIPANYSGRVEIQAGVASSASTVSCSGGDTIPPATIANLSASTGSTTGTVDLNWTAPGDDGTNGTASQYIVRYNTVPITENNWGASANASNEPSPNPAGSSETMTVSGLTPGQTYYFAIKTQDEVPNTSGLSNSPSAAADATVAIIHMEVIQVTQDEGNNVPLIAGKPALVRVYVKCVDCPQGTELPGVTGVLKISTMPQQFTPDNNGSIIANPVNDWTEQRDDLNKSLNFLIPGDFLTLGDITLTANVQDDVWIESFFFELAKELNVIMAPIKYKGKVPETSVMVDAINKARLIYPTSTINSIWYTSPISWDLCIDEELTECPVSLVNEELLLQYLNTQLLLEHHLSTTSLEPNTFIYGFLPGRIMGGGARSLIGWSAIGDTDSNGPSTFIHELGHLLGLLHSNTEDNLNHIECLKRDFGPVGWRAYVDPLSDCTTNMIQHILKIMDFD